MKTRQQPRNESTKMTSRHESRISKNSDGTFYTLIVRIDRDGETQVIHGYKGRHFTTLKAAERSTRNYIAKM